jgi:DNA repair exonuclease SbcCD ATPase subunit
MIVFKTLRWKNFLSTGNLFTEIDLNKSNNTLIVGENGSGKSTILDALSFAIFGKPFRKVNKPQLINSITKKDMVVEIFFSIGTNNYKIVRGMKPAIFEVYMNNKILNQSSEIKDYQEILESQILKISHKSFCQVVVLGSASFVPFMQLPSGQRRDIIEDLLDLQIFTTMNSLLKDKIAKNNDDMVQIVNDQKIVNEKIKIIKEHMLEVQNNNEKIIEEKIERIEEAIATIDVETAKYVELGKEIQSLKDSIQDESKISSQVDKLSSLKHRIEAKRALLDKDIKFFMEHDGCPTCKQVIDEQFKAETISSKKTEMEEIDDGLNALVEQYDATNQKLKEYMAINNIISDKNMEQYKIKSGIDGLVKYRNQLEKEINLINEIQIEQDDNRINELETELNSVVSKYNNVTDQKQIFGAASAMLKDGGIKSRIIKQYVPIINKLINKYLSAMDFFVQFELDEEFNETIKSRFRDDFSYASFSEGEKMRINLAILFTWRAVAKLRNSVNTNLLIMDEVFDSSLDTNGTEEFMKIINQLTQDTNTFIISHKGDQLFDKFETVIKFEKTKNFSKVVL